MHRGEIGIRLRLPLRRFPRVGGRRRPAFQRGREVVLALPRGQHQAGDLIVSRVVGQEPLQQQVVQSVLSLVHTSPSAVIAPTLGTLGNRLHAGCHDRVMRSKIGKTLVR